MAPGTAPGGPAFLLGKPAGPLPRRRAGIVVLVLTLAFLALLPFAQHRLPPVPAFIPVYESALVLIHVITAMLLIGQARILRSPSLMFTAIKPPMIRAPKTMMTAMATLSRLSFMRGPLIVHPIHSGERRPAATFQTPRASSLPGRLEPALHANAVPGGWLPKAVISWRESRIAPPLSWSDHTQPRKSACHRK